MNICYWLIEGQRCTNPTSGTLVCNQCLGKKRLLYKKYKSCERKVINAISNPEPRGNIDEVQKVIARLNKVIVLRKEFTSHLYPTCRDYGHELRIHDLYEKVKGYRSLLQTLIENNVNPNLFEEDDREEIQTSQSQSMITCIESVHDIISEIQSDPFADFSEDIKSYQELITAYKQVWLYLTTKLEFDQANMTKVFNYIVGIREFAENVFRRPNIFNRYEPYVITLSLSKPIPSGYQWERYMSMICDFLGFGMSDERCFILYLRYIIPKIQGNGFTLIGKRKDTNDKSFFSISNIIEEHYCFGILSHLEGEYIKYDMSFQFFCAINKENFTGITEELAEYILQVKTNRLQFHN